MAMEDRNKLPKWAQGLIKKLENDLAYAQDKLAAAIGTVPSRIEVDRSLREEQSKLFLRDNMTVTYNLGATPESNDWQDTIEVHLDRDPWQRRPAINIRGGDGIIVYPHSSNLVLVQPARLK